MGKTTLLIGIGGTGCAVVERLSRKLKTRTDAAVLSLAVDTDAQTLEGVSYSHVIPMTSEENLGSVVERLGEENLSSWFPCDWDRDHTEFLKTLDMSRGANQWRAKSLLSFADFLHNDNARGRLHELLGSIPAEDAVDLYVAASLAGGTGSGLLAPFTLYVKKVLAEQGKTVEAAFASLACQDIFSEFLSAEQRVKTSANAYAALRELHAMGLVAGDRRPIEEKMKKSLAHFCIGDENDTQMGVLFNAEWVSEDEQITAPFDRVFLTDKIPGVTSVAMHTDVMADALLPVCDGTFAFAGEAVAENLKSTDAVYGGLSSLEIHYPEHSIVNYITKKRVFETISGSLSYFPRLVEESIRRRISEMRSYGRNATDGIDLYVETVLECADEILGRSRNEQSLLARDDESVESATETFDVRYTDLINPLYRFFETCFPSRCGARLQELIEECFREEPVPEKGEKKKSPRVRKAECKQFLLDTAREAEVQIKALYKHGLDTVFGQRDEAANGMHKVDGEGVIPSMIKAVLSEENTSLNPVLGLVRLCQFYVHLQWSFNDAEVLFTDRENVSFEKENYLPHNCEEERSRYGRADRRRFYRLAEGEESLAGREFSERELLGSDIKQIVEQMCDEFSKQLGLLLIAAVEKAILGYRAIFSGLNLYIEDYEFDVRMALNAECGESSLSFNIASDQTCKQLRYNEYIENRADAAAQDVFLGQMFCSLSFEASSGAVAQKILSGFESWQRDRVCEYVESLPRQTVLQRLLEAGAGAGERTPTQSGSAAFRRSLRFAVAPLHLRAAEPTASQPGIRIESRLLVSPAAAQYVYDKREEWEIPGADPADAVQHLMFLLGEYEVSVRISDAVPDDKMYVVRYTLDNPMHVLRAVDELHNDGTAYKHYCKAIGMMVEQGTQMWNPHLCRGMEKYGKLPYINPRMQKMGEDMEIKAVLYGLASSELFLIPAETDGELIYAVAENGLIHSIDLDEQSIVADDYVSLFVWVRENEAFLKKWSEKYDAWTASQKQRLPAQGFGTISRGELKRAITGSPLIRAFRENLFGQKNAPDGIPQDNLIEFAYRIGQTEQADDCTSLAARVLSMGQRTMEDFCTFRFGEEEKEAVAVICEWERAAFEETLLSPERNDSRRGARLLAWAQEQNAFLPYLNTQETPVDDEIQ